MKMTKKAALASLAALTLAAAVATPTYARRGADDIDGDDSRATSTESRRDKRADRREDRREKFASSTLDAADLGCLSDAVAAREDALLTALDEFNADAKSALEARKEDLAAAYAKTDRKEVKAAVKSAWKTYRESMKASRGELKDDKKTAYKEFKDDAKTCGGGADSADTSAPGEEMLL